MRTKIDRYGVVLWSSAHSIAGYINLYGDDYNHIGQITLYNQGEAIPGNSMSGDKVRLHFPLSKYSFLIDLLRNEDPVYLNYNDTNKLGTISTSKEETGEGE